jgi:hypothetical protein
MSCMSRRFLQFRFKIAFKQHVKSSQHTPRDTCLCALKYCVFYNIHKTTVLFLCDMTL